MNQEKHGIVSLAAPALLLSQNPETEERPYSEYNLIITAPNHRDIIIEGVQILPDTIAQQNVFMHTDMQNKTTERIQIEDNTLWGDFPLKIPEDAVKELPPPTGFVVLPQVVIPEYIVVHAGVPDDTSAPNYYVPFKDYIKNVASSEVYANWPTETLVANILAILSLTLNRVYTEWYRGKGFNFTITNSTRFDQAFTYGRNIFDEISVIVDNIFNTYITKPEIRQPLFAQYNDGQRVNNPGWLSQWGSKYLGDQGYDHMSILRNYYGNSIFLANANSVAGVPSSYPGTALQTGSSGSNVTIIQEQLNAISNNYPAIPKMRVDGIFGPQTRDAVITFQGIFNMPQSGIVDFSTWYRISHIYVAVAKLAEMV
ncbi:MAG: peptidoglycan-binding protein [Oscillospiraceae bacterium]|nr:peptidoglycan-binding protein [Oscillospiraceae bacterium]